MALPQTMPRNQVLRIVREHMESAPLTRASVTDTGAVYISTGALAARYLPCPRTGPGTAARRTRRTPRLRPTWSNTTTPPGSRRCAPAGSSPKNYAG
ncbi:hypothetical protein ACFQ0M_47515 [Kitasatospora aburaviensis]